MEMTRGCAEIAKAGFSPSITAAIVTALISFGGFCVFGQAMTYLSEAKIKARYYLAVKTVQAALGGLTGYLLGIAFIG